MERKINFYSGSRLKLAGTLSTPPNYEEGNGKLPGIIDGRRRFVHMLRQEMERCKLQTVRLGWMPDGSEGVYWFLRPHLPDRGHLYERVGRDAHHMEAYLPARAL